MQGGFSIREYTSRMRSVDVVRCWPFDEAFCEETVKSLLPPIVVKRFTWWLDELQLLDSETADKLKKSEKKTKKVLEKGETSSRNVDRDLEGAEQLLKVVKFKSLKGKMRVTKKRSIVEIFEVAPPIKRAVNREEEAEEVGTNRARKNKNRNKKMKMKNTDVRLTKALRMVKKIKRKKAAAKRCIDEIDVPDKENCIKLKLHAQEKATLNSSPSSSKELDNDIHDCVSNPKRKQKVQDLGPVKRFLPCKAFKLIEENQHLELPVRGILKNQCKEFSRKQLKKHLVEQAVQLNGCSSQKANKQVTFLEYSELLRSSGKPSRSTECFKLQKDCDSGIVGVDYAVAVGKDSTSSETSAIEDASARAGKELGDGPASDKQLTMFSVDSTTLGKQNFEGEHSVRSGSSERSAIYSDDLHWPDHDLRDAPHITMDACPPGFPHMPRDRYYNGQNVKVVTASANATSRWPSKDSGTACSVFPPMCFEDYRGAHSIHFQASPRLSPNELLQTFCSLPYRSQNGDIRGRSTSDINKEFVGLPLNSQGELITLNSSAKRNVNQMVNSSVSAAHCIDLSLPSSAVSTCLGHHSEYINLDTRTSPRSQLNLFPMESYVKENDVAVIPSRLGIIESQSVKANLDFNFPEIDYHPFHYSEETIHKGDNQARKGPENEKCQSTMRLMGKEFEVGGRGVQGFENGWMWKDKQIIDELHFQNQPSFGELRGTLFCPSEISVNHRSESKCGLPHFDCQTSSTYSSVFLRTVDCAQNYYPSLSPGSYSEVYNSKPFLEPYTTGYDSQFFTLELPKASTPQQELCSNMSPSSMQQKDKPNLQFSSMSAIKFPFMHPDLNGHFNYSRAGKSSLIQQPLCFEVSDKATQLSNSQCCTLGHNRPYPKPGTSHGINSSVSFQPNDFCMNSPLPPVSAMHSMAPAPLTPLPYYPGVLPGSAMQRRHGNQNKINKRIKTRIGIRDLNICKRSKGQLSALSNAHVKPLKRPTLGFHEGLQCAVRNPETCVSFEDGARSMEDALGSCSATKNSTFELSGEYNETSKDGQTQTILPFVDSYVETARTGPIKLTSGSKHILKSCQQKDQEISLSAASIGFRFS